MGRAILGIRASLLDGRTSFCVLDNLSWPGGWGSASTNDLHSLFWGTRVGSNPGARKYFFLSRSRNGYVFRLRNRLSLWWSRTRKVLWARDSFPQKGWAGRSFRHHNLTLRHGQDRGHREACKLFFHRGQDMRHGLGLEVCGCHRPLWRMGQGGGTGLGLRRRGCWCLALRSLVGRQDRTRGPLQP